MNGKKNEKREIKGYKIKDYIYRKALRRARKEKVPLATRIEEWVCAYAEGLPVGIAPNVELPEDIE